MGDKIILNPLKRMSFSESRLRGIRYNFIHFTINNEYSLLLMIKLCNFGNDFKNRDDVHILR